MSQFSKRHYIAYSEMRNDEFDNVWGFCHLLFGSALWNAAISGPPGEDSTE